MKKILSFLLSFFFLLSMFPIGAKAEMLNVNVVAPNGNKIAVDGLNRPIQAGGELILFTRDNASDLTDTNPWSAAAIVDYENGDYIVTNIVNNQGAVKIPYNGFVLFGHGDKQTWILNNIKIGDKVIIENYKLPEPILERYLVRENGEKLLIKTLNADREKDSIGVFTGEYGNATPSFDKDTLEVIVSSGIVVSKNTEGSKGSYIPSNGYVVSFSGTEKAKGEKLFIGEKVSVSNITIKPIPEKYVKINNLIFEITGFNIERGERAVIIYDSSFGKSTNTNTWGMELTVVDGKITAVKSYDGNPNNSEIPQNGQVISIQISNPQYKDIQSAAKVGEEVKIVTDNLTLYKAGKTSFDAYNPKTREDNPGGWDDLGKRPYPGHRGTDQLIVYDKNYGSATTGTNIYGYEVTVNENNKVVKIGGNNSPIPEKGYVLSGHGAKDKWLKDNVTVGSTIVMNKEKKEILTIYTPESIVEYLNTSLNNSLEAYNTSKNEFRDINYGEIEKQIAIGKNLINDAKAKVVNYDFDGLKSIIKSFENSMDEIFYLNTESRKVEFRAAWIRPKETNIEQVRAKLDNLAKYNINTVYLETWFNGYTIFPTENTITMQNPMYKGFDVFKAYIEEGKKRGMDTHAWVENFFVGVESADNGGPVHAKKPEWSLISRKGDDFEQTEVGKCYFINPALQETRDFVMSIYHEIIDKYDVAGLQIDYVRYPDAHDGSNDFGYDKYTRDLFKEKYGVDPIEVTRSHKLWDEWCKFRAEFINTFVYRVYSELKEKKPNLQISADVWPNYEFGPTTLMQEPKDWVSKGFIDNLVPMSYMEFGVLSDTINTLVFTKDKSYATMGISAYSYYSKKSMVRQISEATRHLADGVAIFEYESMMANGYGDSLIKSVFRNEAIIPDKDIKASTTLLLEEIIRKTQEIYAPNKGINSKDADKLIKDINKIIDHISKDKLDKALYYLGELEKSVWDNSSINKEVASRINESLDFAKRILVNAGVKSKGEDITPEKPKPEETEKPEKPENPDKGVVSNPIERDNSLPKTGAEVNYNMPMGIALLAIGVGIAMINVKRKSFKES